MKPDSQVHLKSGLPLEVVRVHMPFCIAGFEMRRKVSAQARGWMEKSGRVQRGPLQISFGVWSVTRKGGESIELCAVRWQSHLTGVWHTPAKGGKDTNRLAKDTTSEEHCLLEQIMQCCTAICKAAHGGSKPPVMKHMPPKRLTDQPAGQPAIN